MSNIYSTSLLSSKEKELPVWIKKVGIFMVTAATITIIGWSCLNYIKTTPEVHFSVSKQKVVKIIASDGKVIPISQLPTLKFDGYTYVE